MNKISKIIITFIISFVIAYLVNGFVNNGGLVGIKWVEDITVWGKLRWYYVINFTANAVPSFVIAIISTVIIGLANRKRK